MGKGNRERNRSWRIGRIFGIAAFFGGFVLGCVSSSYQRSCEQDDALSARVNEALGAGLPGREVTGKAFRGVVALLGKVPTEESRLRAERLAREVAGVARVNNLILVVGDSPRIAGTAPVHGTPLTAARAETAPAP